MVYSDEERVTSLFFASLFLLWSPSALLCANWKILSFISLLLPATGAGWRIHASQTMRLRRCETKEAIWRQHLASPNKEIASAKLRSGQLQEAELRAGSQSVRGEHVHAGGGFSIVLDFTSAHSTQMQTDKEKAAAAAYLRRDRIAACEKSSDCLFSVN